MKNIIAIFSFILLSGCIYEPPPVNYIFIIKNNSDYTLYVEHQAVNEEYLRTDSIVVGGEYKTEFTKLHCYQDFYGDTLINTFYKKIRITVSQKEISINLFNRVNWKESLHLKNGSCKGGDVSYLLTIYNKDINEPGIH